jgi:hypothetical protein
MEAGMTRRRYIASSAILNLLFTGADPMRPLDDGFSVTRRRRWFPRRPG